ncbi:MAG: PKD domain-containing protein, partial [Blastocatellia bacterium]
SYAGVHWSVKNLFELKNAQRVLIEGNVFENCWVDGQTGFIIVFTPRNQEGTAPWSVVQDVTFTNNICRHGAAGIQFLGYDDNYPSQQEQRIKVKNNLFHDVGAALWGGNGRLFQLVGGTADVRIDHNTAIQTGNIVTADGDPHSGFVFTNNITPHNDYGVMGSGRSIGNDSLGYYFPGYSFSKNVVIGGPASLYPVGNFFPSSISEVQFVDYPNNNYRLAASSTYRNAGTDGRDIGADQDAILVAIGGAQIPPPPNQIPQVSITASTVTGNAPLIVNFTSDAYDPDGTIASYSWNFGDGQTSSLPSVSHTYQTAGSFNARLTVVDNQGASATASILIQVTNPPLPAGSEVVLYTARVAQPVGRWNPLSDSTAAGGRCLWNPDSGAPKLVTPLANPSDYFEMSFNAVAGRGYRLWIRAKAQNDNPYNDSVFIQFSQSVDSAGASVFRIGTPDATTINLEDCSGCGLAGWGWQDNGWGVGVMGPLIYFSSTGPQTLRVQVREDGLIIDQIVLSPETYLSSAPGALTNDNTILSESSGLAATTVSGVMPTSGPVSGGTNLVISGNGFSPGATVTIGGAAASSVRVQSATSITAVTPFHFAGLVDVVVTNADGRTGGLSNAYRFVAPNQPPQVSIAASTTSGAAPLTVILTATGVDPDGVIAGYNWNFGDGQTSTSASVSHVYQSPGVFVATVTVTDNSGATASSPVTITVNVPNPTVTLLYPNGGEVLQFDSTCVITWSVSGPAPTQQDVYLSLNGGSTWTVVAERVPITLRQVSWRVPKSPTNSARIKIRLSTAGGTYVEDVSNSNFSIQKRLR